jgi:4-hydroxy-3-methylbut-2-enyl diphosphate reductase
MEHSQTPEDVALEPEVPASAEPVGVESSVATQPVTETPSGGTAGVEAGVSDIETPVHDVETPVLAEAPRLAEEATPARKPSRQRPPARPFVKPSDEELAELRKRAAEAWDVVVAARESGENVSGTVISVVKGGLLVDIGGIRGFLPASQVRAPEGGTLDALVKTVLPLKVLDLDAPRRRAVVSARRALDEIRRAKRGELLRTLVPGQRREGVVVRLTDFGAFVDLGGIDGLIPMSELALERVEKAADAVSVGERLELEVLRVDEGGKKISLSRKNALPDPWRDHAELLKTGTVVTGKVVAKEPRLSIELAPGVVGVMRDSDADPADYEIGESVEVSVRTVDRRARRLTLATPYAAEATRAPSSGFAPLGEELRTRALR